jgi:hypothetical protein
LVTAPAHRKGRARHIRVLSLTSLADRALLRGVDATAITRTWDGVGGLGGSTAADCCNTSAACIAGYCTLIVE